MIKRGRRLGVACVGVLVAVAGLCDCQSKNAAPPDGNLSNDTVAMDQGTNDDGPPIADAPADNTPPDDGQPELGGQDLPGDPGSLPPDGPGCLPCPSAQQPACTPDVTSKAVCANPGNACCDPTDHFWLCRCVAQSDGGRSCAWMNACGN